MKWTSQDMNIIEEHISSSRFCSHNSSPREIILTGDQEGSTPLIMACHYGEYDSVEHIVERWWADVRSPGVYHYKTGRQNSTKFQATPLFVAAINSHSKIVHYLIRKRADVFTKATINRELELTPFQAAFVNFQGAHSPTFDRIRNSEQESVIRYLFIAGADPSELFSDGTPIWEMNKFFASCGIDQSQLGGDPEAIMLLIELGMVLTQRSPTTGRTILHHCARLTHEKNSLAAVKLLLSKGVDLHAFDNDRLTPILSAAIGCNGLPNVPVLEFFLEQHDIGIKEKIEALELAASVFFLLDCDYQDGLQYLSRARRLRSTEMCPAIPLTSLDGRVLEWDEVPETRREPSEYEIQGVLIQLRIFSNISMGAINSYLWPSFKEREVNLDIYWNMLKIIRRFGPQEKGNWSKVVELVHGIVDKLTILVDTSISYDKLSEMMKKIIELISATDQTHLASASQDNVDVTEHMKTSLLPLVQLLASRPEIVGGDIMRSFSQLVRRGGRDSLGRNLLHLVCIDERTTHGSLSQPVRRDRRNHLARNRLHFAFFDHHTTTRHLKASIRLLLQAGANPNSVDKSGNGPLHFLADNYNDKTVIAAAACFLVDYGAQPGRANKLGKSAVDTFCKRMKLDKRLDRDKLPSWCRETVSNLKCLSACVIRVHNLPSNCLPLTLKRFVTNPPSQM